MNIAKETFQVTGLRPANPDVLSDEGCLASEVINRPQGNMKEDPPGESGKELLISVSIEKKVLEGSTSSDSPKHICNLPPPPRASVKRWTRARISQSNIFPIPKTKAAIKRARSARRSEIMTLSPFKNSL
jgi:hypothetical protein